MPVLENVTTKTSELVWTSPDGQRKIYKLGLEWEGKPVEGKTYSDAIGTVGWQGTIETYEKPGRNGSETFVKQPPKENGFSPGGGMNSNPRSYGGSKPASDNFTMYLSYAKDIAIACLNFADGKGVFDDKLYGEVLAAVEAGGVQLYSGRPEAQTDAKAESEAATTASAVDDGVPVSDEELAKMNDIFGPPAKKED